MVKKCIKCGTSNSDEDNYCYKCGTSLQTTLIKPPIKPVPIVSPIYPISRPSIRPLVVSSIVPGMCYYHNTLPAMHICGRCGKQICYNCSTIYFGIVLCPPCQRKMIFPLLPLATSSYI